MSNIEKREEAVHAWAISHAGDGFDVTHEKRGAFRDGFDAGTSPAAHSEDSRQMVCKSCGGNNADVPCAYPEGGQPHCLRAAPSASPADPDIPEAMRLLAMMCDGYENGQ